MCTYDGHPAREGSRRLGQQSGEGSRHRIRIGAERRRKGAGLGGCGQLQHELLVLGMRKLAGIDPAPPRWVRPSQQESEDKTLTLAPAAISLPSTSPRPSTYRQSPVATSFRRRQGLGQAHTWHRTKAHPPRQLAGCLDACRSSGAPGMPVLDNW